MFYVIQHMDTEGPGLFSGLIPPGAVCIMAGRDSFPEPGNGDVFLIMGGVMGVYETAEYPFIEGELRLIRQCRDRGSKVLGVCLGAQMIAGALGGRVYKGSVQETGWYPVELTAEGRTDRLFAPFPVRHDVFQWHGDTFDLPPGAIRLAGSDTYPNQAFRVGDGIYGLQYHLEVTEAILREWFPGPGESKLIDIPKLAVLEPRAREFFSRFLDL